jgi:hypothetical protein
MERYEATLENAVRIHNEAIDRYVVRAREAGVDPIVY